MSISVKINQLPAINFSMQQNCVPVFRSVELKNTGDEAVENLTVTLSFDPDYATPWSAHIERIDAGADCLFENIPLQLSATFFLNLTESLRGGYRCTVAQGEEVIETLDGQIDLLAFDQWMGAMVMPELLAAFVTPNVPEVTRIVKRASEILGDWTQNPSLDEYQQRDPDRVQQMMAALFAAVKELEITYSTLMPNYEDLGQRIRLCDAIGHDRLANCLEMTVLYASCLEAMGLNSLIVLIQGHAFVGGWLIPDTFPDTVNDDVSLLTKRTAAGINELMVLEATMMCKDNGASFEDACKQANYSLVNSSEFLFFVDIQRARVAKIKPLPTRIASAEGWSIDEKVEAEHQKKYEAPKTLSATDIIVERDNVDIGRQTIWERKLLDLSLRNNLLNTRISRGTLQIISSHVNELEDAFAAGEWFSILPRPTDWDNPLVEGGIYKELNQNDPMVDSLAKEQKANKLRSYLNENDLKTSLTRLYRSSRLSMEENGANTLYFAIGMLKWFETPTSHKPRYAPILLLPVEIVRGAVTSGYRVRSRDEETVLNVTLIEMLRQFFDIKVNVPDPLPKDESGVDVPYIFNAFRRAVMNMPGWDVQDMAMLGTFSFSKFVMWNDIHSHAPELARNSVVESLINSKLSEKHIASEEQDEAEPTEDRFVKDQIVLPISADSSQMMAISAALNGKSFILHGPPGTGKSQTITNIIANALYKGQRVLFVAEKMAALQVVQNRLEKIGLAPFCLELHSNRAQKSTVLAQLQRTTEVIRKHSSEEYRIKAAQLSELRKELSSYETAIHKIHPSGLSLYDCMSRYAGFENALAAVGVPQDVISALTPDRVEHLLLQVKEYQAAASIFPNLSDHPLRGADICDYAPEKQKQIETTLAQLTDAASQMEDASQIMRQILDVYFDEIPHEKWPAVVDLVRQLRNDKALSVPLVGINSAELLGRIQQALSEGKAVQDLAKQITESYLDSILSLDAQQLHIQWRTASSQWFLKRLIQQKNIAKQLQVHARSGARPSTKETEAVILRLADYASKSKQYQASVSALPDEVRQWVSHEVRDIDLALAACDETLALNQCLYSYTSKIDDIVTVKQRLSTLLKEGIALFHQLHDAELDACIKRYDSLQSLENSLNEDLRLSASYRNEHFSSLTRMQESVGRLQRGLDQLREWCIYNNAKQRLQAADLVALCQAVEDGKVKVPETVDCFQKSLYKSCAEDIISHESQLTLFHGVTFEDKIVQYKQLCNRVEQLTQEEIVAHLSATLPSLQKEAAQGSEVGILQRNIRNGGRGTSLRKLFDQISGILPRMCPCMLMSPMSVAQYIDPSKDMFDLVIFDEASQMPTCEAVGAIARGKNLIVVGDPNQMPPTSFFSANTFDEDNADKEDLESILDDCLALSLPSLYLKWHYRSKNESLIAFSNVNYYDNKLMTFPSPDDLASKVTYQYVEGVYERGASRQNKAEADAVVREVESRLSNPATCHRSIGIVTFNTNQQSIIEDKLTDMLDRNPALAKIAAELHEPVFVKNLENVQGDERDVILFSVGFGPDKEGRIALNFGPLNREGGWRRLNVAVSRARYEMKVFSTLRASDIDLNRTSASGVAGLKAFLDFADKGRDALAYNAATSNISHDGIVNTVAEALRAKGHEVKTNIGCSGYKIDMGVVDPRNPSQYILGVIFDGYNYSAAKTTRDREVVQPGVLKVLGWQICRVWSMSWWLSPDAVVRDLEERIQSAIDGMPEPEPEPAPEPVTTEAAPAEAQIICENPYECQYTVAALSLKNATADEMAAGMHNAEMLRRIVEIVNVEAPISQSLLFKKVVASMGITRVGPRLSALLSQLASRANMKTSPAGKDCFCWRQDQDPDTYLSYRPISDRDALDIAPQEVATAAYHILKEQGSLPEDALLKELARVFQFTRLGTNVQASMARGLENAEQRGLIQKSDTLYAARL